MSARNTRIIPEVVYHRDNVGASPEQAIALDDIVRVVHTVPNASKQQVAEVIRSFGLTAYIGGRHVSVNTAPVIGTPERLAMFTGNFGDWL